MPGKRSARQEQIGGDHYTRLKIQPFEFSLANNLDACQHTAIKYIVRKKGDINKRLEDIDKAIHTLRLYRELLVTSSRPQRKR